MITQEEINRARRMTAASDWTDDQCAEAQHLMIRLLGHIAACEQELDLLRPVLAACRRWRAMHPILMALEEYDHNA